MQNLLKFCGQASLWGFVYVLQFLQWWYQREHLLQPLRPRKPPPPPPRRFPYPETGAAGARLVVLPEDRTICPLCHRPRQNPAMSCGGYAFCYTCLVPHVPFQYLQREFHVCCSQMSGDGLLLFFWRAHPKKDAQIIRPWKWAPINGLKSKV